ncbi:carbohydrate ABC transporter permease [Ohessyouella blattaphilus]|uniref:Sugar ABC transporter permease n=1 Tax=Ohessyouella blattaphilus TaxID=2949333 RepID=A0ABT1EIM1_9FIRM|nr:sugar ABC transporter permease [Ohessyouella blattaphilus]MCP1110546.1 sugar ABC transporter permease [Ohessyouella blattaphilus]MCR8563940.1 sugar ABC transporter permease [Ohessyouella blattaphilus]MDL2249456.1 sugar ABC transporter permease [Lachnospiraceae bacterium OttesenSCG-928-J05]
MNKVLGNKKSIAVFVLPAFIIYAVFVLIPIGYNVLISFFQTDLMSPSKFVGLKNYENLFHDKTFIGAMKNNILMVIGSLIAHLPLALLFGNILFQKIKGSHFFQTVFFLPSVICGVAVGLTWTFVYNSEFGLLNKLLELIGLGNLQQVWLADKNLALLCIIVVVMWQFVGYHMIIQLAAMRNIPESYYEAARIDGASKWVQFKAITFPLIKPILKVDAVLIITGSLKYYDLVAVMTGGGPNHATELMSTYMFYQGFRTLKYGYSAGIGVILLIMCICSVLLSNFIFRTETIEY